MGTCYFLGCSPAESRTLHSSDFPSDGLAERLRDRLRLVDVESVYADLESGAAFLDHQAQAGPRRVAEVYVVRLVADAADRFLYDARQCRRLAGVEAIDGALASERLSIHLSAYLPDYKRKIRRVRLRLL